MWILAVSDAKQLHWSLGSAGPGCVLCCELTRTQSEMLQNVFPLPGFGNCRFKCSFNLHAADCRSGCRRVQTHRNIHPSIFDIKTFTPTPAANSEFPSCLTFVFLDCGRKMETPEQAKGEHENSTQRRSRPGGQTHEWQPHHHCVDLRTKLITLFIYLFCSTL